MFDFEPEVLLADVQNAVDAYIDDASDALETALIEECGAAGDAEKSEAIRDGTDELNAALTQKFGKQFAILGAYAQRNIFHVDDDLRVPHSAAGGAEDGALPTAEEEAALDKELAEWNLRLRQGRQEEKALRSKDERIKALQELFETHKEDISQLKVWCMWCSTCSAERQ